MEKNTTCKQYEGTDNVFGQEKNHLKKLWSFGDRLNPLGMAEISFYRGSVREYKIF